MSFLNLKLPPVVGSDTARQEERLVLIVHKHWWALLREIAGILVLFIVPFILVGLVSTVVPPSIDAAQLGAASGFVAALWALLCWHLIFSRWTDFYFDVWIITNWRIIDLDLRGLFHVDIATILDLDHIQDIQTESVGVIQNLLGFGLINIQTAATRREVSFIDCPTPRKIESRIREAQTELMRIKGAHGHV